MKNLYLLVGLAILIPRLSISQVSSHSLEHDGLTRDYLVFLPEDYNPNEDFPVVINLHGYGHSAEGQMEFSGMNGVADTAGFIVVYPDAVDGIWNSGIGDNSNWPTPEVDDVGFIDTLLDTLATQFGIDSDRKYLCGVSNGGFMTIKLACQLGDHFAALASVAGVVAESVGETCNILEPAPFLYIHGTEDPIIPYGGGSPGWFGAEETLGFWMDINGCSDSDTLDLPDLDPNDGCTVQKITFQQCDEGSTITFMKVNGGGHTWPSSTYTFNPSIVGNTNYDINASAEILAFFKNFPSISTSVHESLSASLPPGLQVFPNPFSEKVNLAFTLDRPGYAELKVLDLTGNVVAVLTQAELARGDHQFNWFAGSILPGMYIISLKTNDISQTFKVVRAD